MGKTIKELEQVGIIPLPIVLSIICIASKKARWITANDHKLLRVEQGTVLRP